MVLRAENSTISFFTLIMEKSENMQVSFIQDSGKVILPIVSCLIKESDTETVEASVFYDSGAQVSIIRTALAEHLCLQGKPLSLLKWEAWKKI